MIQTIPFVGPRYTGTIERSPEGISVFVVPSDPDAEPMMSSVTFDPSPEQVRAIAAALAIMAEELTYSAAQLTLLGFAS